MFCDTAREFRRFPLRQIKKNILAYLPRLNDALLPSRDAKKCGFFHGSTAPGGPVPPYYQGFTVVLRHTTLSRTTLDEWSARHRDLHQTRHYCRLLLIVLVLGYYFCGSRDNSVGIAARYRLDAPGFEPQWIEVLRTLPDRPWGPWSLLQNG